MRDPKTDPIAGDKLSAGGGIVTVIGAAYNRVTYRTGSGIHRNVPLRDWWEMTRHMEVVR